MKILRLFVCILRLQFEAVKIAFKLKTYVPLVVPMEMPENVAGRCYALCIGINISAIKRGGYNADNHMHTLYHECRHVWQFLYFTRQYCWWIRHKELYRKLYHTEYCAIEEDARVFGKTLGKENRTVLLYKYGYSYLVGRFGK